MSVRSLDEIAWDLFELGRDYGIGLEWGDERDYDDYIKEVEKIIEELKSYENKT